MLSVKVGGMRVVQHKSSNSSSEDKHLEDVTGLTVNHLIWICPAEEFRRINNYLFFFWFHLDWAKHRAESERCSRHWKCGILDEGRPCCSANGETSEACSVKYRAHHQSAQQTLKPLQSPLRSWHFTLLWFHDLSCNSNNCMINNFNNNNSTKIRFLSVFVRMS